jgi:hypothetical protein
VLHHGEAPCALAWCEKLRGDGARNAGDEACRTALQKVLSWACSAYRAEGDRRRGTGPMSYRRMFTFWGCARACGDSMHRGCERGDGPSNRVCSQRGGAAIDPLVDGVQLRRPQNKSLHRSPARPQLFHLDVRLPTSAITQPRSTSRLTHYLTSS